ncbi:hypothetical protein B0H67DRAFT_572794 [Lasiosphaeris hirsuta]|uniref:PLL-like beta propeller domain-containing protein n=1 Tax=Lasiosphaeris hirsuta TaxID=260670 RepID=A0AA40E1J4_9PEZI|nr:hypothetical protein B0H67DRAFT_572794 [Lasiosphaeris hirsuta]
MVFARGVDNNIWYNTAPAAGIAPWPAAREWQALEGGPFMSQPVATTWNGSTRVSVTAVSDPDHSAQMRHFTIANSVWGPWQSIGGRLESAASLCVVNGTRLDVWAAAGGTIAHNFYLEDEDGFWMPTVSSSWQESADFGEQKIATRPAMACRWNEFGHDVVVYGADKTVQHSTYSDKTSWTPVFSYAGAAGFAGFQGDPVVLASSNDRIDFFGVGVDAAIYHGSWTASAGHSALERLGGSFQSVPAAVVTRSGRIDVVALGTSDTLQHKALVGAKWPEEWEDLGVFGNSAPLLQNLTTTPESVAIFVLGKDGEMNQTVWTVSSDLSWKNLDWAGMGGNLTSAYFRN